MHVSDVCSCGGHQVLWGRHTRLGSSWLHRPCCSATLTGNKSPSWSRTRSFQQTHIQTTVTILTTSLQISITTLGVLFVQNQQSPSRFFQEVTSTNHTTIKSTTETGMCQWCCLCHESCCCSDWLQCVAQVLVCNIPASSMWMITRVQSTISLDR